MFKDGVWIRGLFLEGAGWDKKNSCLIEAEPMQLVSAIPTIHFKPVENKKKSGKGLFYFLSAFTLRVTHQKSLHLEVFSIITVEPGKYGHQGDKP